MNIAESIVQGYMFHEMDNEQPTLSGGYPLNKLVNNMEFISQSGGKATRETPLLKKLEHLAIPIGLVYQPHVKSLKLEYKDNSLDNDGVISPQMFDKLVDMVSHHTLSNKTHKQHQPQPKKKITIKHK